MFYTRTVVQCLSLMLILAACIAPSTTPSTIPSASPTPSSSSAAQPATQADPATFALQEFLLPAYPHDVAPDPVDPNTVWWTAQGAGALGRLNPGSGENKLIPLGRGSSPHGVIVGPDGAAWVTDSGQNAIVRVDASSEEVTVYPLPAERGYANLNTGAFDGNGIHWFTGQNGIYGRLDPATGEMQVFDAPRGRGPYGIDSTPGGEIYYASLAGSHIARIDTTTGEATPIDPPTPNQGARRVWSDSQGRIWVSEYNAGQVGLYDPATGEWREWHLPAERSFAYAVYVDEADRVWLSDFGANALVMFEPTTEQFYTFPLQHAGAAIRQILGREGEVWAAESGANRLLRVTTN